ncbi:hypothetical protein TNIN_254981 [Trichonephila inaurata madagascariensis]|uniref:Uncharacterized protein n=1 Tax=Trichonephila inaurata madagascariensis TaxID=2747483 RepID=A0A8X6WPW7_9ARAC|nr:hypothetical protein TNIN_254981 [Trichonephila inaurata madagascariensis]
MVNHIKRKPKRKKVFRVGGSANCEWVPRRGSSARKTIRQSTNPQPVIPRCHPRTFPGLESGSSRRSTRAIRKKLESEKLRKQSSPFTPSVFNLGRFSCELDRGGNNYQ